MMVRSPDIDHAIKPTAILIVMIGDVRSEVGQRAIGLAQDAILVVTKIRRTEPQGSVLFKGKASLLQALKGFFNSSALHKRTLGEPHLMLNPEFPQVFLDAVEDGLHTVGKTPVLPFRIGKGGQPWIFVHHLARNINDIGPSIVIFRPFHSYSGKFLGTQPNGKAKEPHLAASVVDIVFRRDVITGKTEDARQGIAHRRAPAMTDMERAGGVCRNVLHLYLAAFPNSGLPKAIGGIINAPDRFTPELGAERHVQKAGASHFNGGQGSILIPQGFGHFCGQLARRHPCGLGGYQRQVGSQIAVLGIFGRFDDGLIRPGKVHIFQYSPERSLKMLFGAHVIPRNRNG